MRESFGVSPRCALRTGSSKDGKTAIPRRAPLFAAKPITIRQGGNNSSASIKMYDYKMQPLFFWSTLLGSKLLVRDDGMAFVDTIFINPYE